MKYYGYLPGPLGEEYGVGGEQEEERREAPRLHPVRDHRSAEANLNKMKL